MAQPLPKHRSREYETIFILNPEISVEGIEQIAARLTDVIGRLDGKLLRAENWGKRRLAYPVRKNPKGFYVYLRYLGYSDMVEELERNMRMIEPVIKYLTVKLEEDVDPTARPVREEDISFLPKIEEVREMPESIPAETPQADAVEDAATPAPAEEKAEAAPAPEAATPAEEPADKAEEPAAPAEEPADKADDTPADKDTETADKAEE